MKKFNLNQISGEAVNPVGGRYLDEQLPNRSPIATSSQRELLGEPSHSFRRELDYIHIVS